MYSGLLRFRDLHANTSPVLWLASASTAALWILGGVVVWRRRSHATLLVAQGLTLAVASASLASVAVPWYTRHHLIAIGGVLIASALLAGVLEYAALRRRAIAAAIALTLIVTSLLASRSMLLAYGPCDPHTLDEDRHVATWIGPSPVPEFQWVPPWLDRKALLCASPADHDDAAAVRRGEIIR
ncbi:MAG: hypothetical protein KAY59_09655, partial [Acidobacteria bacterium]|nr:hypothetical protein [Acidobacteriota bacterium]